MPSSILARVLVDINDRQTSGNSGGNGGSGFGPGEAAESTSDDSFTQSTQTQQQQQSQTSTNVFGGGSHSSKNKPGSGSKSSNDASLYLFVFLATLLLLLALSIGILMRSFILRRRFRRRVEEALANGVFLGPRLDPGGPPVGRWKKPELYDVTLVVPQEKEHLLAHGVTGWENIKPLSAMVSSSDLPTSSVDPSLGPSTGSTTGNRFARQLRQLGLSSDSYRGLAPPPIIAASPTTADAMGNLQQGTFAAFWRPRPNLSLSTQPDIPLYTRYNREDRSSPSRHSRTASVDAKAVAQRAFAEATDSGEAIALTVAVVLAMPAGPGAAKELVVGVANEYVERRT